jgi:hypothetical protein
LFKSRIKDSTATIKLHQYLPVFTLLDHFCCKVPRKFQHAAGATFLARLSKDPPSGQIRKAI